MRESKGSAQIVLPEQKNYEIAYNLALKLTGENLANRDDIEEQCQRSEATYEISGQGAVIYTKYLNRTYRVTLPDITVSLAGNQDDIALRDKILILHYLERAKGTPLANKLIGYKELEEGAAYYPSFFQRAIKPLIENFGPEPDKLAAAAGAMGGNKIELGDAAVIIPAFSRVPIYFLVWKGDDEFPPDASILFDQTILDYLSAEDINVLCQTITWKMIKASKSD